MGVLNNLLFLRKSFTISDKNTFQLYCIHSCTAEEQVVNHQL